MLRTLTLALSPSFEYQHTDSRATSILVAERLYYPSRETYSFLKFAITELFPLYLVTLRIVTETL